MIKTILKIGALLVILFAISGGCNSSSNPYSPSTTSNPPSGSPPPTNTIVINNFAFSPGADTVMHGVTITWKNDDGVAHTSTSDTGVWDTGSIAPGSSKSIIFNNTGTFPYHCAIHTYMRGTIVVM